MNETPEGVSAAISRTAHYVEGHGGPFDLARLSALLPAALRKDDRIREPVPPHPPQNSDGGWPAPWSEGASSLDATCLVLDLLSDFATVPPEVDTPAAMAFLTSTQLDDGTWREGPSNRTPDRLMPGSAAARVYLTANCARALAALQGPQHAIERAAQSLEWSLDPHGRLPGGLPAHWLGARVLRAVGHDLAARRLLDVVGRSFEALSATDLVWFGSNTPTGDRWTRRIAARLMAIQAEDGSWPGEDGEPSASVSVTACRVLLRA